MGLQGERSGHRVTLLLLHTEFLGVFIKHQLVTCDERDVQQAPGTKESLAWDALDQGVTFELRSPDGQEILALARQLSARLRKIICCLVEH